MVKLKCMKVANSVKCGTKEETFLSDVHFDMTLEQGVIVRIVHKKLGDETFTTLMNTVYWKQQAEASEPAQPKGRFPKAVNL